MVDTGEHSGYTKQLSGSQIVNINTHLPGEDLSVQAAG
jgi:hypothetical protein